MTRTRTRRRWLAPGDVARQIGVIGIAIGLCGSCGGSTRRATPTTSPPTSQVVTASTVVVTTAASSPTTSAPVPSTTTVAPTTTAAPATPEQQVRAAWRGWIAAGEACNVEPKSCERAALAMFVSGTVLTNTLDAIDSIIAKGWRLRTGAGSIDDRYMVERISVTGGTAEVQFCEYDAGIVDLPGSGPNGEDVIVNDQVQSRRDQVIVTLEPDKRWRVSRVVADHSELGRTLWESCVAG